MISANLGCGPVWRAEELGRPIPSSEHAVSVALPTWRDVVGYEEKHERVTSVMNTGYPRFVIHPLVKRLAGEIGGGDHCLPFPSRRVAEACGSFVREGGDPAEILEKNNRVAVSTTGTGYLRLRAFWQHTGLIVSSREADSALSSRPRRGDAPEIASALRRQLASFYDCEEDDVFLAPSGMAAQYAALAAVKQRTPNRRTIQIGFPYVDTLKLQQKFGAGGELLHDLQHIEQQLGEHLQKEEWAACFSEIPGNPLLGSADIGRISPILRARRIPLIADDVVATPANVDLGPYADLIATSLTKFIVGSCDAMGGALICNPRSPLHAELKSLLRAEHEELLWPDDAVVLESQAQGFPERMKRHNAYGLFIAERLRQHSAVERVWYPKWEFSEAYEHVRRPDGGWGALITFLPKNAESESPRIYDRLELCKGPSLGAIFSLVCPFTLLAHYSELEWAEACGVSRYLLRISVGLEDPEVTWQRIRRALEG